MLIHNNTIQNNKVLYDSSLLNDTLKCHILRDHVLQFMVIEGTTLARVSDEAVESAHSKVRKREERLNLKASIK